MAAARRKIRVHAEKVRWQVLQQRFHTTVCTTALITTTTAHPPSAVAYSSNKGTRAFMEEREIEGRCSV